MRKCLRQIRATGEADSIRGYAVTRLHAWVTAETPASDHLED